MSYQIARSQRFKRSYKRISRSRRFNEATFITVVEQLAAGKKLDRRYRDHSLTGNFKGYRECHLAPDILLIYKVEDDVLLLTLVNIGSHAHLFKK
jgi:mRNA interferase YafQ